MNSTAAGRAVEARFTDPNFVALMRDLVEAWRRHGGADAAVQRALGGSGLGEAVVGDPGRRNVALRPFGGEAPEAVDDDSPIAAFARHTGRAEVPRDVRAALAAQPPAGPAAMRAGRLPALGAAEVGAASPTEGVDQIAPPLPSLDAASDPALRPAEIGSTAALPDLGASSSTAPDSPGGVASGFTHLESDKER